MKIDNSNLLSGINSYRNEAAEQKKDVNSSKQGSSAPKRGVDTVEFSVPREQLANLKKALDEMPEVRAEKVAAVQEQMIQGTYNVSGQMVATRMLGEIGR